MVLPDDPAGCRWQRASLADPPGLCAERTSDAVLMSIWDSNRRSAVGLLDFPNSGVSDPYDKAAYVREQFCMQGRRRAWQVDWCWVACISEDLRQYEFMDVPLIAPGGHYNLCWCGPRAIGQLGSLYLNNS